VEIHATVWDQFDSLDPHIQDCTVSKLNEVVELEWRDPDEFLEPLNRWSVFETPRRTVSARLVFTLNRIESVADLRLATFSSAIIRDSLSGITL